MLKKLIIILTFLFLSYSAAFPTLKPYSGNEYYWEYEGSPVLLIGGMNSAHNVFLEVDIDNPGANLTQALDDCVANGQNVLRCVLDPGRAVRDYSCHPYSKSSGLYNLNNPLSTSDSYFGKINTLISLAKDRDIIVQLEIWNRFDWYNTTWGNNPFRPAKNSNYTASSSGLNNSYSDFKDNPFADGVPGHPEYEAASSARKAKYDLVRGYQEIFVDHLLSITLQYDNVLYCMNNETHVHPAWGKYWIDFVQNKAASQGKTVYCTDMFDDGWDLQNSDNYEDVYDTPNTYTFVEIAQNNQIKTVGGAEKHWANILYVRNQISNSIRPINNTKIYASDIWKPNSFRLSSSTRYGDFAAVNSFWMNIVGGCASARFHRRYWGIGCNSTLARNCSKAVRKMETKVKMWELAPRNDLLSGRGTITYNFPGYSFKHEPFVHGEAYLATKPGEKYVLYFTRGGTVSLNLNAYSGTSFDVDWINIEAGDWDSSESTTISGGGNRSIQAPSNDAWVAVIISSDSNNPPTVNITTPADSAQFDEGSDIDIEASASDYDGSIANVKFYIDDVLKATDSSSPYTYLDWDNVTAGTYEVKAVATDNDGATDEDTITVTVTSNGDEENIELEAEDGTLSGCNTASYYDGYSGDGYVTNFNAAGDTITLNFNADSSGTEDINIRYMCSKTKNMSVTLNGTVIESNLTMIGSGIGNNKWNEIDISGNIAQGSNTLVFTKIGSYQLRIDKVTIVGSGGDGNNFPNVNITIPADGAQFNEDSDIDIEASASDSDGSISNVKFYIDDVLKTTDNSSPYAYLDWDNVTAGTYEIKAVAIDNEGATAEDIISITVISNGGGEHIELEAEDGSLSGCAAASYYGGHSGSGYVKNFNNNGDTITLTFSALSAGSEDITIRAMCNDTKNLKVILNGTVIESSLAVVGSGTGDNKWVETTVSSANIKAGSNTLILTKIGSYQLFIDKVTISGSGGGENDPIYLQTEDGSLSGCTTASYYGGYNGTGYVKNFNSNGDTITLTFNASSADTQDIVIRAMCSGTKNMKVILNGTVIENNLAVVGSGTGDNKWVETTISSANIKAGSNTLILTKIGSYQLWVDQVLID